VDRRTVVGRARGVRPSRARMRLIGLLLTVCSLVALAAAANASAGISREFDVFKDCPLNNPETASCIYSTTTSGEFKLGNKSVPINKTVVLQGGLSRTSPALIPAADGNTLSKTQLQVPGGIIGIELLGPLTEVNTTAELAGTVDVNVAATATGEGTAVSLPLKAKLENPLLGGSCYVGTDSNPFTPQLTTGTTNPPAGVQPLTGSSGKLSMAGDGKINVFSGISLVDNTFSVPGASGCGGLLSLLVDPGVDLIVGIPAGPGHNSAVLSGSLEQAGANIVKTQLVLPEIGRCVKVAAEKVAGKAVYHGLYLNAGCTFEVPQREGKYEWEAGTGGGKKFTGAGKGLTLESVGGKKLKCTEAAASGEYTGLKTASIAITLTGCTGGASKEACQSAGAPAGEIQTGTLSAELGFIEDKLTSEGAVAKLGWDLKGSPVSGTCGSDALPLAVSGSLISPISAVDKMVPSYSLANKAKGGVQETQAFEEEPADTLSLTLGTGGSEPAGLSGAIKITNEEKLEFKGLSE
jgi:hypothetical protein